ncbi:MAG: HD-GYP domain-containing protein [Solirubrobacteraceae bacterium]
MSTNTEIPAGTQRLLTGGFSRRPERLLARERVADGAFAAAFLVAAVFFAWLAPAERTLSLGIAAALVAAYVLVGRAQFHTGAGFAVPTQIVLVPMLLLLPTPTVPLLVALALVLSTLGDSLRGGVARDRALVSVADAWHALAPAAVLVLAGAQTPDWGDWPVYVAALAAQVALDSCVYVARVWACLGEHPRVVIPELKTAYNVDALLAPVALLAAFAAADQPYVALLVVPLAGLFTVFARERSARIEQTLELSGAYKGTALLLGDVIEADDEYTGQHTQDVVELTVAVADSLRVGEETRLTAEFGALLHDVGKVAIPNEIINKPGPLDDDEWAIMKTHTVEGQRMLERVGGLLARVGVVVRASHERFDGGGYPDGLAGEAIPLAARIVSACDAYNAMTTDRSYRKALPAGVAVAELRANSGTQFDPAVVDALVRVVGPE